MLNLRRLQRAFLRLWTMLIRWMLPQGNMVLVQLGINIAFASSLWLYGCNTPNLGTIKDEGGA